MLDSSIHHLPCEEKDVVLLCLAACGGRLALSVQGNALNQLNTDKDCSQYSCLIIIYFYYSTVLASVGHTTYPLKRPRLEAVTLSQEVNIYFFILVYLFFFVVE